MGTLEQGDDMKRLVKLAGMALWKLCGSPLFLSRGDAVILTYHRVLEDADHDGKDPLVVPKSLFKAQLAALRRRFTFVDLAELLDMPPEERCRKGPFCVLTFDDGWKDNYSVALPVMETFRAPATIFLCTGYVDTERHFWWHTLDRCLAAYKDLAPGAQLAVRETLRLAGADIPGDIFHEGRRLTAWCKTLPGEALEVFIAAFALSLGLDMRGRLALTGAEARGMLARRCTFGGHTVNHVILSVEREDVVRRELAESLDYVRRLTGRQQIFFSYPDGGQTERDVRLVEEAGYAGAVTVQPGIVPARCGNRYALPRIDSCGKASADRLLFAVCRCALRRAAAR